MDTTRSDRVVERFRQREFTAKRKVQQYERVFSVNPARLFPLLCPAREADWIPGWNTDLVYTSTGYAELDCVFTTGNDNPFGSGTWILTAFELDRRLDFAKVCGDHILQGRIELSPLGADECLGRWTITVTSLTPEANELIEAMPDKDPRFVSVLAALEHYLKTGHMARTSAG